MNVFLRVVLYATVAFGVVEVLPLAWFNFVLCWIVVVMAAYRYPHMILARVQTMSSAVGFSVGMGAAIGAIVNTAGMCIALVFHTIFAAGTAAHDSTVASIGIMNGFSALGDFMEVVGAPFVGAVLGLIGGLIGGSTVPKSGVLASSEQF